MDAFVFLYIVHLQKAPITASSENMPDSQSSAYQRKYSLIYFIYIFKPNIVSAHNRKNTHDYFLVNILNHGKNLQEQQ